MAIKLKLTLIGFKNDYLKLMCQKYALSNRKNNLEGGQKVDILKKVLKKHSKCYLRKANYG